MSLPKFYSCPKCREERVESKVRVMGSSRTMLGAPQPYYGTDGCLHIHDPNRITHDMLCERGHKTKFVEAAQKCPAEGEIGSDCSDSTWRPTGHGR